MLEKYRPFSERHSKLLNFRQKFLRFLFYEKRKTKDGFVEGHLCGSCMQSFVPHYKLVSLTRLALLALLTLPLAHIVSQGKSADTKPLSEKTPATLVSSPTPSHEAQEIVMSDTAPETQTQVLTLKPGDTLWERVREYLVANNLPHADADIQRITDNLLENHPDIDETCIPAWSEFQITREGNGMVSVTPLKR